MVSIASPTGVSPHIVCMHAAEGGVDSTESTADARGDLMLGGTVTSSFVAVLLSHKRRGFSFGILMLDSLSLASIWRLYSPLQMCANESLI
jgi:hypothetical protein